MKKKTIRRKSIIRIIILGIVILIGACAVSAVMLYRELLNVYNSMAETLVSIITMNMERNPDEIIKIATEGDFILTVNASEDKTPLLKALSEEQKEMLEYWEEMDVNLYFAISNSDILNNFQIIVPEDDGVLCLWNESSTDKYSGGAMTRRTYRPGERKILESLVEGGDYMSLEVFITDNEIVQTIIVPVIDFRDSTIKVYAELDVVITSVGSAVIKQMASVAGIIILIMAIGLFVYFLFMWKEIISPIVLLEKSAAGVVEKLRSGEEPVRTDICTRDEIEDLAHSFENMETSLRKYIDENAAITARQERMATELALAASIQDDMLPNHFPVFEDRNEFDLFASMTPAKEVGGDFYDFFLLDENTLALVIADVSGKGVPASLFMMKSMLMIENIAMSERNPSAILERVNGLICSHNDSKMFVTVWLGLLDIPTGTLKAANAGHEYPVIKKPDSAFELYKDAHSFVVGGFKATKFKEYELHLAPGTKLFLYTDGATEARNSQQKMFRIEGVVEALNKAGSGSAREIVAAVENDIRTFVKDEEQFDDLTMMCLVYNGPDAP